MRVSLLFAVVLAAGCGSVASEKMDAGNGSGSGDAPAAADFTLSVSPDTLDLAIASSATVTVTVQRDGMPGDIMLAANSLPTGVSITFATNPLPEGTDTTMATVKVAGGSAAATGTASIVGTAGSKEHAANLTITTHTITVTGTVSGGLSGVVVGLVGKPSTTSDSMGHFTFTDVTPPYDLYTYRIAHNSLTNTDTPSFVYYDDLTRTDPVISYTPDSFFGILLVPKVGYYTGSKTGTGGTGDPSRPSAILWSTGGGSNTLAPGTNNYSGSGTWVFGNSINGTLYGIQWTKRATGAPMAITGFGSTDATLSTANTQMAPATINLNFTQPSAAGIVGTISPPAGYANPPTITLTQQLGSTNTLLWQGTTTDATATIPVIAAGKSALYAIATTGTGNTQESTSVVYPGLNAATDVTFTLPAAASLVAPLNGATNVNTQTSFQIDAPTGFVYQHRITSGTAVSYTIISTATSVKIPSLPEKMTPPSNASFSWTVTGFGPMTAADEAATDSGLPTVGSAEFTGMKHMQTNSQTRTFTSAP